MENPQAAQPEGLSPEVANVLIKTLQDQRNTAHDELAKALTNVTLLTQQGQQFLEQHTMLNKAYDELIKNFSAVEEEAVALRAANAALTAKLEQAQAPQPGVVSTLMTADNPPAVMPPSHQDPLAPTGGPVTARGSES